MAGGSDDCWPDLNFGAWQQARETLHLWTQIVGKIRLMHTPWLNHSWHVALYVNSRGLSTSLIPYGYGALDIQFDFIDHSLKIQVADGEMRQVPLRPQSVADFFAAVMSALEELGFPVAINPRPCEIAGALPFGEDRTHAAYDPDYCHRFWKVLLQTDRVLKRFRTGFLGKCSPVHFFWGSFDLAVTRFSGRRAPRYEGKIPGVPIEVMREAYSHEVSSAGFWPGGNGVDYPAFYSYAYPTPENFRTCSVGPLGAFYSDKLGQFLLPYDTVRTSADPEAALLTFLQSTFEAAAQSAGWNRAALECALGRPGTSRAL